MTEEDWDQRIADLWSSFDDVGHADFLAAMRALVELRPADDPVAIFELASAHDATDDPEVAIRLYRQALRIGLGAGLHRQAVIQLASSLRAVGSAADSAALLTSEMSATSDELDDAVRAFLALALVDLGRERQAVSIALTALAGHLPRYRRSIADYARALTGDEALGSGKG